MRFRRRHAARAGRPGQATVEFSIAITLFLTLTFGVFDVSRAAFTKHGISRAAGQIVHELEVQYATTPTTFDPTTLTQPLLDGKAAGDIGFSTSALTKVTSPQCTPSGSCEEWTNATTYGGSGVYVCGILDTISPYIDMLQVTVRVSFSPAVIQAYSMPLSESATAMTSSGEDPTGSPKAVYYNTNACPSH